VWSSWSLAPETLGTLVFAVCLYGAIAFAHPAFRYRGGRWRDAGLFMAGIALLAVAWVSPLCRMAATLAWAHMLQHLILVALAPPLLVLGASPVIDALRRPASSHRSAIAFAHPAIAGVLYGASIWFWHVPALYQAALLGIGAHLAMYGSLLGAGLLFWASIVAAVRRQGRGVGMSVVVLLVTMVHTGLLGALLTFSRNLWYPLMAPGALSWGVTPLEDQQLAGLIMWVPMGAIYLLAALGASAYALSRRDSPPVWARST
jgi:cytochrome c oxidase assembly factor CtaG